MKKIIKLPKIAKPTIEQALEEFLSEQMIKLKPKTASDYRDVIQLFKDCMNGYAYQSLSKTESALFEKHYNAEGQEHKEFCQLFGPDKIVENTGEFLGYFLIRKVMAGGEFKRLAGAVIKKLSKWAKKKGRRQPETFLKLKRQGIFFMSLQSTWTLARMNWTTLITMTLTITLLRKLSPGNYGLKFMMRKVRVLLAP